MARPYTRSKGYSGLVTACISSLLLIAQMQRASAQSVSSYAFSQSAGSYSSISGGTVLDNGNFDDGVFAVTIPSFFYAGTYHNTMYVSTNGFLTFGSAPSATDYAPISSTDSYAGCISPFGLDIEDADAGSREVRWQTVGSDVVVQWKEVKRYTTNTNSESFSFQARLNTSTGVIRFIYGSYNGTTSSTTSPQVGLRGANNSFATNVKNRLVNTTAGSNTWATSIAGTTNANTCRYTSGTVPSSGQTYTFTPPCVTPIATAGTITTNCGNNTFSFAVNVTNLGSATNVDIVATPGGILYDNVGIGSYVCTLTNGTSASVVVTNNSNSTCNLSLGSFQGSTCLPSGVCGQNLSIPDNGCGTNELNAFITVAPGGTTLGTNVFLTSVDLIVSHTNNTDLEIDLISPSGSVVRTLIADKFGTGDNLGNPANCPTAVLRFQDGGTALTNGNTSNVTGTYAPQQTLAGFNGQNPNGSWRLQVCDDNNGSTGAIRYAKLNFQVCSAPAATAGAVSTSCALGTFSVPVTINGLGSASNVDIVATPGGVLHNDVGTGTYTCGPFTNGTAVTLTVVNNQNAYCNLSLGSVVNSFSCMTNGVCENPGPAIPDDGCSSSNNLDVGIAISGLPTALNSTASFESIDLILSHTYRGDLNIYLISPTGQTRNLYLRRPTTGASGDNLGNPAGCPTAVLKLKDGAAALSTLNGNTNNAAVGTFAPEQTLAGFTGDPNGTWNLRICDAAGQDVGNVRYVKLNFLNCAPAIATANVVEDCVNGVFRLSVVVSNTGSGATVDLVTNLLGMERNDVGAGTYLLGPYPTGSVVNLSVRHQNNSGCDRDLVGYQDCCTGSCTYGALAVIGNNTTPPITCGNGATTGGGTRDARWFKWVAPYAGTISISACAQTPVVNTYLRLHSGACGALTFLQQDDDGCSFFGGSRILNRPVTAGTSYFIEWDNRHSNNGFTWQLQFTATASTNPCAPLPLVCGASVSSNSTSGAPNTLPITACAFNGAASTGGTHWWSHSAATNGEVIVTLCGNATFNSRLSVFEPTPSCTMPTCVAMNDDSPGCPNNTSEVRFAAQAGHTYHIAVHGSGAAVGTYTINLFCQSPCTPAVSNDACATAVNATSVLNNGTGVPAYYDNSCSHVDDPTSASGAAPAVGLWYNFNAGLHAMHRLHLPTHVENQGYTAGAMSYALYSGTCNATGLGATGELVSVLAGNGTHDLPLLTPGADYRLLVYNNGGISQIGSFGFLLDHPGLHDAGVTAVSAPTGVICGSVIAPVVTLKNFGEATLTQVILQVSIDGGLPVLSHAWTGSLAFGNSEVVSLPAVLTPGGMHTVTVSVLQPNGQPDEITANNAASSVYDASGHTAVVVLNADANAAQTTWTIYDAFFFPVANGGGVANSTSTQVCLASNFGDCYTLFLYDSGGDGLCCGAGNGFWEVQDGTGRILLRDQFIGTADGTQSPALVPATGSYVSGHEFCLPAGPSDILANECGIFTNNLLNKVYCAEVPGAVMYQFEFSDPDAGFLRRIAVPRPWVKFGEMVSSPLLPGVHYFTRVRVDQGAAGMADDRFGGGCEMGIDPAQVPGCTQLIDNTSLPTHSCGAIKTFGGSDKIWAVPVVGGTLYKFKFVNIGEGYSRIIQSSNYVCVLNWVTMPLVNGQYDVTVNVLVNGQWSGFCGASCQLTIFTPPVNGGDGRAAAFTEEFETVHEDLLVYPNPVSDGQITLSLGGLTGERQEMQLLVTDLQGKVVMSERLTNEGDRLNRTIGLDRSLTRGLYLLNLTVNGKTLTKRITVL